MKLGLKEKVVLVTGASRGIGKAIAAAFAAEGSIVVLNARRQRELELAAQEMQRQGGQVVALAADVTKANEVQQLVERVLERYGTIHVLVNNAGGADRLAPFEELSDEEWINAFQLNVLSTVRLTRAVLPSMQQQKWGRIINISSESATQPYAMAANYTTTKAAITNLSKSLAKAYARDGILVNTVSPAMTWTPLVEEIFTDQAQAQGVTLQELLQAFVRENHIELGRPAQPEEVASAVVYLASEAASFITGTNLRVDGGTIASI